MISAFQVGLCIDTRKIDIETFVLAFLVLLFNPFYLLHELCMLALDRLKGHGPYAIFA